MQRLDLAGIDNGLAVEAQLLDEGGLGDEAFLVVDVGIHRIQGGDTGGAGGVEDHAAGKQQLDAVGAGGFQVGDIVLGSQGDADEAVAGVGDLGGVKNAVGAFNGGHHAGGAHGDPGLPLDALDLPLAVDDVLGAVGFGQAHHLDPGPDHGLQVLDAQAAAQVVDADHGLLGAEVQGLQGVIHQEAGGVLFGIGHGVLQVEHDGVGPVDMGVADHAGVVAGHEHHTAAQSVFHIHVI